MKRDLQGRIEELEEENEHLKRQQMIDNEIKRNLRQETSQLTAENMVGVHVKGRKLQNQKENDRLLFFPPQDFEELLDQRDRLIKKLHSQIKSLETSQKGSITDYTIFNTIDSFSIFSIVCLTAKQTSTIPKDYLGMLEYKREDETRLIQNIIIGALPLSESITHIHSYNDNTSISQCVHRPEAQRCGGQHAALTACVHPLHVCPPR